MSRQETSIRERENIRLKEPRKYKVIIFNDDFTTMDFVVRMLMQIFYKNAQEAEAITMTIHRTGQAVAGIYTYDIASSKVTQATSMAQDENFPLRLTYLPAE